MAKEKNQKSMEETLWKSANKLRGSVESSEYKHIVLGLIFLKFVSDTFEERREKLLAEGKESFVDMVEFYTMENVFYLPAESRWSYIKQNAKQDDIAFKIDTALATIEKNNPSLKGALPDNYFSRLGLDVSKLSSLIDTINNINTIEDKGHDIVGGVYEYFLSNFVIADGKGKREFSTPKSMLDIKYGKDYKHLNNGEIPLYGSGGIMKYVDKYLYSGESMLIPRKGSLNNIIHINQKFWTVDTMFYSIIKSKFSGKYLYHILKSIDFYSLNVGSAVPSMTTNLLNGLKILKPENYVLENFEKALIPIFKHKSILKDENETLERLKEVLLSKIATIEG
ncbi:type I restriction-modification system subunit M N-terminal domain-containing protein [Aliarcobacter butzleri]|uniref:type I restriction-modification system subunit M N-terminal domain-containing protein n=1 Tax=Aliarcobacter butzleri TaxID=28197 RepID=UPI00263C69EC|nr:type I restriction-modification system subunit M N-terminal domain-containing protein [Aliarcobacter butzleri]MDN5046055.1 type I restriction-modification system subunit M N-terminal domain-containing protein [Aliarcobacter butzleri]